MADQGAASLPDAGGDPIEVLMGEFIRDAKIPEDLAGHYEDAEPGVKATAILGAALRDACTLLAQSIDRARSKVDEMACGGDERWKEVRDEIQGNWISEPLHADVASECMFEDACRRIAELHDQRDRLLRVLGECEVYFRIRDPGSAFAWTVTKVRDDICRARDRDCASDGGSGGDDAAT